MSQQNGARAFYQECERCFARAANASGTVSRTLQIAGLPFRFQFAGSALVPAIMPALEQHLAPTAPEQALTIRLWDGSTSASQPRLPWDGSMVSRRGDIREFGTPSIHAAFDRSIECISLSDTACDSGFYFARSAPQIPIYETAAALRTLFYWLLRAHDRFVVHAGAVGNDRGAVLFVGKGGSGKSTSALACLDSELRYLGEDYCVIAVEPVPRVWNLYSSAKVTDRTRELLPFLNAWVTNTTPRTHDKAVLFLQQHLSNRMTDTLPLKGLIIPQITSDATPRLLPTTPQTILGALSISTMLQLPNAGNETLAALTALTNRLPCYMLETGRDPTKIPSLLNRLLS